jgi:hypothetical protein
MDKFAPQSAIHLYVSEEQHAGNSKIVQLPNGDFSFHVRDQQKFLFHWLLTKRDARSNKGEYVKV